jgi:hypothetical protein
MSELSERILRVTADLRLIQEQLSRAAQPGAPHSVREAIMQEMLQGQMISEFKGSVDHMRHLLWSYIEASAPNSHQQVTETLQAVRMQRVTEMLKVLQPTIDEVNMMRTPEAKSFLDLINQIASSAMDRHTQSARQQ